MEHHSERRLESRSTLVEDRSHPNHWLNRAADLKASAGALWHAMGSQDAAIAQELGYGVGYSMKVACWPVYHMLCGLSLELVMKAVLVQRETPQKKVEIHFLNELHRLLALDLDDERKQILDFYEASVVWAGRYPTPRNVTDEKLLSHYDLESKVLTKPMLIDTPGTLSFMVSSETTDWGQFSKLWLEYANLFSHA
ncbi:hypothetical protein P3C80_23635 [Pseudomonas aeruginosa]|uniref:hypothetical protein n=1 Tax=Pseudomonas aeruginosa TaxID=287 RepID=UPI0021F194A2|nr:hypothetical protein [Pseudomonas aeruginosa]MCV6105121.1 hypothetical protein [Pseudomonas aeruginosa]MDI2202482.1 hypothetical protein [Pseudomonas aeruginosa]MDY1166142.1 hypothetical protein [Pseudomonas aeruginosa]HBO4605227.1 hypothetical protein [Pseudomonas aeruginosa]